jgi:hypothetical protein
MLNNQVKLLLKMLKVKVRAKCGNPGERNYIIIGNEHIFL